MEYAYAVKLVTGACVCGRVFNSYNYKRQLPVNYLTDGKIFKGFNEEGRLVAVYDRYNNMMTVEYDDAGKITRVYDGDSKQIVFDYRPNGLLDSITDARGRRTSYDYTDSKLTKMYFADGRMLNLEYFTDGRLKSVESSDHERAELAQSPIGWNVIWKSDLTAIRHGEPVLNMDENRSAIWAQVDKVTISYVETTEMGTPVLGGPSTIVEPFTTSLATITNEDGEKVYYRSDADGNVCEYYEETDGKITKAERYEINFYASEKVLYANEESLYKKDFSSFTV